MLDALIRASVAGMVAVAVAWTLCRLVPRLSPAARTFIWWCAAAKFLIALVWAAPVEIAVPDAAAAALPSSLGTMLSAHGPAGGADLETGTESRSEPAPPPGAGLGTSGAGSAGVAGARHVPVQEASFASPVSVRAAILWTYAAGVLAAFAVAVWRWVRMRQLVDAAEPAPLDVRVMAAQLAGRLGLEDLPDVRISDALETPLVAGLVRPTIVLPGPRLPSLPLAQQRMVLCHELAHVRRGDLVLGCVPALAERLFFFHPLAHLAAREFALWREAACDDIVLETLDAAPREYGRLLLDLGIARPRVGLAAAGAPWSLRNLKRRLLMLGTPTSPSFSSRLVTGAAVCLSLVMLAPLQLVGREQNAPPPPPPAAPAPPAPVVTPPVPAVPPAPPASPAPPRRGMHIGGSGDDFMLLTGDDEMIWHAQSKDHVRVRNLKRDGEPMLWFRRGGQEYVVRDPKLIAEAEAIWKPVGDLGGQQGELGGKQGALGAEMGRHGGEMGALGAKQGELGSRVGELAMKQAALSLQAAAKDLSPAEQELLDKQERDLEIEMEKFQKEMELLGEKMKEIEAPMRELEKQMQPLARQMEELGRRMEAAAKDAESRMKQLMDRAIREGTAEPVK